MKSGKAGTAHSISIDQWHFYVNGYVEPYRKETTWANDWLVGGITLIKDGQEFSFPMNHLLIEELEDLKSWLTKINEDAPISSDFDFVDADLFFKLIEAKEEMILRLTHGYDGENQIFIDTYLREHPGFISLQIERVKSLLELFPCRCGLEHNLFSKQF